MSSELKERRITANVALLAAFLVAVAYPLHRKLWGEDYFSPGGAASTVFALLMVSLIFEFPGLIRTGADGDGKASTMRVLSLAIVGTFCGITIRTGWDTTSLPTLRDQGNWVMLVMTAIGGKAGQAYIEMLSAQAASAANQRGMATPSPAPVSPGSAPSPNSVAGVPQLRSGAGASNAGAANGAPTPTASFAGAATSHDEGSDA